MMSDEEVFRKTEASQRALAEEFPELGVLTLVVNAMGICTVSTNMNPVHASQVMVHMSQHLLGNCKCGLLSGQKPEPSQS